jgi:carboxypeptidase C (cathepsin A)
MTALAAWRPLLVLLFSLCTTAAQAQPAATNAQDAAAPPGGERGDSQTGIQPAVADEIQTRHELDIGDRTIGYTATVGSIGIPEERTPPDAFVYYTSYRLDGADAGTRPISFVINGGPGAASAFLQMGALGPKRLAFGPNGQVPDPPARSEANPLTWLSFTDLVFIDPVGTGYSRAESADDNDGKAKDYWSVGQDLDTIGMFIRQYLTRTQRWQSPKVLVGESYGGFRMASLAAKLPEDFGIPVNGIVLLSPALEFALQRGASWDTLPWILRVPTMAAIARATGKAKGSVGSDPRVDLADVETFTLGPLLTTMAAGGRDRASDLATFDRLADMIGLPRNLVRRERGRISIGTFADRLLEDDNRSLSLYDGTLTAPRTQGGRDGEDYLTLVSAAFATAYAQYARDDLGVATGIPYLMLNKDVFRRWRWSDGNARRASQPGAADDLAKAMLSQPNLRLLIAHGAYDLVTPYFGSVYLLDQLFLDPSVHDRAKVDVYPGGHMFYGRQDSQHALHDDAMRFYQSLSSAKAPG